MSDQSKTNTLLVIVILGILLALGSIVYEVNFKQKDVISETEEITNYFSVEDIYSAFKHATYIKPEDLANKTRVTETMGGDLEVFIAKKDETYHLKDFNEDDSHFLWEILKEYDSDVYKVLDFRIEGNKVYFDLEPVHIDWNKVVKE